MRYVKENGTHDPCHKPRLGHILWHCFPSAMVARGEGERYTIRSNKLMHISVYANRAMINRLCLAQFNAVVLNDGERSNYVTLLDAGLVEVGRRARSLACYHRTQRHAGEETRGGQRRGRWRAPVDAPPRTQKVLWNAYPLHTLLEPARPS